MNNSMAARGFDLDAKVAELKVEMAQANPGSFTDFLSRCAGTMSDIVNAYLPVGTHPDMQTYLYGPLERYNANAGKRHRPLITALAAVAVGGDPAHALSAGSAIEHFHTAALIHDDIADEADLRRGEPCMHHTEGEGLAINAGDLALSVVNGIVMHDPLLNDSEKVRISLELVHMAQSTVEGQAMDLGWARDARFDLTIEDYFTMANHKTAYYSGAVPLAVGAIVGGATDEQVEGLRAFGMATGLAFQIQDDLLNLVGTEEAKEKDYRSDITEGKRTLVVVHALDHSSQRDRLIEILSAHEKDPAVLEEAVQILEESGSIAFARDYAHKLVDEAKAALPTVIEMNPAAELLISMADWFVSRLK
jgi:geranylgeranyl diphosphate synthase type I